MTSSTTGPITLSDVKSALGEIDPNNTNAGKLREKLGRGSFATIQKHLDSIRAELVPVPPVAPGAAPTAPADAVSAIWNAAWAAAQVVTLGRLEAVTAQRDAAQALTITQAQDVAALAGEVDALTDMVGVSKEAEANAVDALKRFTDREATANAEHVAALVTVQSEIDKVKTEAAAAAALAARDAQIERLALQSTVDRLTDQASDLKSLLARLTPSVGLQG